MIFHYICIIFLILLLLVDTEIVFLALVIIANKAAKDMAVQIIPPDSDFISFIYISRSGIAGFPWKFLIFQGTSMLFPMWLHQLTCPPTVHRSSFSTSSPALSSCLFFIAFFLFLFFFWLRWVLIAVCGLSLVAVSGGYSSLWCVGISSWWPLLLQSVGSRLHRLQQLWCIHLAAPQHMRSSQTRGQTSDPALAGRFFTTEPQGKPQ